MSSSSSSWVMGLTISANHSISKTSKSQMELRHLRYFVAVAEERGFVRAALRLHVAQPALSKQVRDLEAELGVTLLERLPRGVRLTRAGEAFLTEARSTLGNAARAVTSARRADEHRCSYLQFAHSDLTVYTSVVADLLAAFRSTHPDVEVRVSSLGEAEQRAALREHRVDVAATFLATWPIRGFGAHCLADSSLTGVLLPASHPLAAKPAVRLGELRNLTFLHLGSGRWPKLYRTIQRALRDRGLVPSRHRERPPEAPSGNVEIAAGDAWALANDAIAAQYLPTTTAIAYRPFLEPPIPTWLALIWLPEAPELAQRLIEVSRRLYPAAAANH